MTTAQTEYGPVQVFENDHIGKTFLDGVYYEIGMIELLLSLCGKKRVAVDVGANIGAHSKIYLQHFQTVYAFEPQQILLPLLKANCPGAIIENVALSSHAGECLIDDKELSGLANYGGRGIGEVGQQREMRTLDSYGLQNVDLLKIDTEGSEFNVLAGAKETIKRCKPVIMYEFSCLPVFANKMTAMYLDALNQIQVLPFLLGCGYTDFSVHGKNIVCR